ncbi:MAG TPA: glycine cleavage system protein GcvH [Calditrichia bacterium]|nr:glycine cleavage system protein GcvH [Calditrichota bacterium]HQU73398.1 glycine cleavage system protein GcvH [Calditrichia bacterium]HQV31528.1 glycine cleavage system protein GcvH [Calditrichia bacterium]
MNTPDNLKYTKDHEWAHVDGDVVTVGITDYAQGELGDIVFVELPNPGDSVSQNDTFGTIEAVKAVSDLYAPVSGEVVAINEALDGNPEVINSDPYGDGWMIRIRISDPAELAELLDPAGYKELL